MSMFDTAGNMVEGWATPVAGCPDCAGLTAGRCWRHSNFTIGGYADTSQMPRTCPTCNGTGIYPVATYLLCPKCNGEKVVPARA